jgi:hypothetical protein
LCLLPRFALYGLFGWCAEVVFTASADLATSLWTHEPIDARLVGHTYLWMFLVYGLGGLAFERVHRRLVRARWNWPARGLAYVLGCFGLEFAFGGAVEMLVGRIPWDYRNARWGVWGLIRLDYAGVWFVYGFLLEAVRSRVNRMAAALVGPSITSD